jgi:hypothetical protein
MEVNLRSETESQHQPRQFECLAGAEIFQAAEDGAVSFKVAKIFGNGKWCSTPHCQSSEVEAVEYLGSPSILTDPIERDLLLYPYQGRCPKCHATRFGGFGKYMDGSSPTIPGIVWLFNAGRVEGRFVQ